MTWTNDRAARQHSNATYGADWRKTRAAVLKRDQWRCQARLQGCAGAAAEVDHIRPIADGGTHDPANLRAICRPCHRHKTATEGRRTQNLDPAPRPSTTW